MRHVVVNNADQFIQRRRRGPDDGPLRHAAARITRGRTADIMHVSRIAAGLALALGLALGAPAVELSSHQAPPVMVPGVDKPVIVVTGEIRNTETWTNDFYYVLRGAVFVRNAATLNIQPGTWIIGESGSVGDEHRG